ncbi:MAG: hypothetical protein HOG79_14345 [Prolixibacteraceae bacterium]|jgi:hypothetical protein|nr:hypothetical protein [Prolixibacteraceae bacterium]
MKITYYIGAGASFEALPLVENFPNRMESFKTDFDSFFKVVPTALDREKLFAYKKEFIKDIEWVIKESDKHASIDTFAKKLYLKKSYSDLQRLKAVLEIFMIIEQIKNPTDSRYDLFYASILNQRVTNFPKNIKIISWNYDHQFELSYSDFSGYKDIHSNQHTLNIITKHAHGSNEIDEFLIIKLNGSLGILERRGMRAKEILKNVDTPLNIQFIFELLDIYNTIKSSQEFLPSLSYAWEQDEGKVNNIINKSKDATYDAEVLVIIGYSFPFFNRDVDRNIIGNMNFLKKVYIQDPYPDDIKDRFFSVRPDFKDENIKLIKNVKQFFLPDEL